MKRRNARWYGGKARVLLGKLRRREALNTTWMETGTQDILADVNAALASLYETAPPYPQELLISHAGYMAMTGHTWVKLGRRGGKWVKR
jgi:hypothetical protein